MEAYCNTVAKYRDRYLSAMEDASNAGELAGLMGGAFAIGDIKNMWVELVKVAPDEIQTDTEAVRDTWKEAGEAALDGDYVAVFANALVNSGPTGRVNDYIAVNCGSEFVP